MSADPRLVRMSTGERAALYIRQLMLDGRLPPGSRVSQDEIARDLGISRIPLREALISLEREGWVTLEMHRGAFVNGIDDHAVEDHFELLGLLYSFALRHATDRSGDELLETLRSIQRELDATTRDDERSGRLLFAVHTAVIDAARSPRLRVVLRSISSLIPGNFFRFVPAAVPIERAAIPQVIAALERHDRDGAADAFREMLRAVGVEVATLFRERGLYGQP
jgi:DNA-binding GntR family transcriptional regulator